MVSMLAGCQSGPPTLVAPEDLPGLLAALEALGQPASAAPASVMAPPGSRPYALSIGGEQAWVFIFESAQALEMVLQSQPSGAAVRPWATDAKVWAGGPMLVVYEGRDGGLVLIFDALFGSRKGDEQGPEEPHPPAVAAARKAVAERLGLEPQDLEALEFEPRVWPDTCLGVGEPGEACTNESLTGWRILFRSGDQVIEARTDALGLEMRLP